MSDASPTGGTPKPRWWTFRRAQSMRPATYRCPFCDELLHAMSEHVVIAPEGNVDRRRHAHTECVRREREAGRFALYDEVKSGADARGRRGRRRFGRRSS